MGNFQRGARAFALAVAVVASSSAHATDGYFLDGIGARSKALGGAGVADGKDATSAALNPAGIVHADNEVDLAASVFLPFRQATIAGSTVESDRNAFLLPNVAINWKTLGNPYFDAVSLSLSGNGGMNTTYPASANVFGAGKAGVDLQQMLLSVALAKKFGNVSVGVAPVVALQIFQADGLAAFGGFSSDPSALTNRGKDHEFGGGVRAGIEWAVLPTFRVGVAGSTPIWTNPFTRYKGLFADGGDFDIPANVQAGIAVDVSPAVTLLVDYRHIWFSDTNSVGDPSTLLAPGSLGTAHGPGFGWNDVDAIKAGVEWKYSPKLILRAGYSYNTQPINSRDVQLNILAPAVVQHHITGGFAYRWSDSLDLELAAVYAPREHVSGTALNPPGIPIDLSMEQFEVTAGFKYRFGENSAPLK
ncbi:OmpP1/FadL family transporter [Hyphomicrobium sp. 99]|uniref:OmpP1/FadL family transporter n=1 Tax=Hyphomicrobium sp. 99 TaxID=1163419 RepID=UPI0005F83E78|nr:outer membrane protein transport protein [Hyphomicrobium sp. 99]